MAQVARYSLAGACAFLAASCGQATKSQTEELEFETSVDPGGCILEHIAVAPGINQYQVDGSSPDSDVFAVAWDRGEEERGVYLLNLKTGKRVDYPMLHNAAAFSPDGEKVVSAIYAENGKTDIVEYDLTTEEMTTIAPHEQWDWLPSYSSDGKFILFNSYRTGASDIYTFEKSTSELKRWTDYDGYDAHAQFSPDDSKILFHRQEDGSDFNLFVIDVGAGETSKLTDDPTEESYASWHPNGEMIVFASDRSQTAGKTDLYLMDASGKNVRQLTNHPEKDAYPFFSPDGKYIYFNSYREPQGVYRIALDENMNCVMIDGEN